MKCRTALVVLAALGIASSVSASAQSVPATPNVISGAPSPVVVGPGFFSPTSVNIYYWHARSLPDSGMVTWNFANSSSQT